MMKIHFKLIRLAVVGALLSSFAFGVPLVRAEESTTTRPRERAAGGEACARLETFNQKLNGRIGEEERKLGDRKAERETKVEARFKEREEKLAGQRADWSKKREEQYAKLEAKATTESQIAAVTAFKIAVEAAIAARRTAVDNAVQAYQEGVKKAVASRKSSVENAVQAFKAAAESALAKAKSDCASGMNAKIVRDALMASLKAAREKLAADRQSVEKVSDEVKALAEVRKTAFDKALADFKSATEKARTDLKAAFPSVVSASKTENKDTAKKDTAE